MPEQNAFNELIDAAKEAMECMIEQYKEVLKDARGGARLTEQQKIAEYKAFMDLPESGQKQVIGQMLEAGIDPEKWMTGRQKLMG